MGSHEDGKFSPLGRGRINRRKALGSGLAAAAGVSALSLVGCGDDDDDAGTPTATSAAGRTQTGASPSPTGPVQPTGKLTLGWLTALSLSNFNPLFYVAGHQTMFRDAIADSLINVSRKGDQYATELALATGYERPDDGLTVTFKLRDGITFHDGTPVTSEDVKFSYELLLTKDALHSRKAEWGAALDRVDTPDAKTAVVRLKKPYPLLVTYNFMFPIISKAAFTAAGQEDFEKKPIAAGPFKFASGTKGDNVSLTAVPNHYRKTPFLQDLVIKVVPDEASRIAQLSTGELDMAPISPSSIKAVEAIKGARVVSTKAGLGLLLYCMDQLAGPSDSPLRDPKVRKALSMAIDRKAIVSSILGGRATLGGSMSLPVVKGYVDIPADDFNIDAAKALLASAGVPNGFSFDWYPSRQFGGLPGIEEYSQVMEAGWRKLGLTPNVKVLDSAAMSAIVSGKKTPGVYIQAYGYNFLDPAQWALALQSTGSFSYVQRPELDTLMTTVTNGPVDDQRYQAWGSVQKLINQDSIYPNLWYQDTLIAVGPKVSYDPVPSVGYPEQLEFARRV